MRCARRKPCDSGSLRCCSRFFSAVAIVVTLVGVYGVAAYSVSRQTREIGVRMALGATRRNVLRTILRAEMPSVAVGITFGMVAALALGGTLSGLLHGVSAADHVTFAAVAVLIGLVAAFAWHSFRRELRPGSIPSSPYGRMNTGGGATRTWRPITAGCRSGRSPAR